MAHKFRFRVTKQQFSKTKIQFFYDTFDYPFMSKLTQSFNQKRNYINWVYRFNGTHRVRNTQKTNYCLKENRMNFEVT